MVKEYFGTYTFPFKWEHVAIGFWIKYPNPFSKHVISEDVISRYLTEDNILVTKKLLVKERTFHLPKWIEKYVTIKRVYVIEESICDPKKNTLTSYTKNFSSTSLMTVVEKCVYYNDPKNKENTLCTKQAHVYSSLFGAGSAIEQFGVKRFQKNADLAAQGLHYILEKFIANKFKGFC